MGSRTFSKKKPKKTHITRKGQGGVAGEVWDLREDVDCAFEQIEEEVDELVTVLNNNTLLVRGQVKVNFQGTVAVAQIDTEDPTKVNVTVNGPAGSNTNLFIPFVDTSFLATGHFGYVAADNKLMRADAGQLPHAATIGCYDGNSSTLLTQGVVNAVKFSNASPIPVPGSRIFLARADDEPAGAAAGKATIACPTSGFVVDLGVVLSVNAATFVTSRTAKVFVKIQRMTKRTP